MTKDQINSIQNLIMSILSSKRIFRELRTFAYFKVVYYIDKFINHALMGKILTILLFWYQKHTPFKTGTPSLSDIIMQKSPSTLQMRK
jgi:hypothetical protein